MLFKKGKMYPVVLMCVLTILIAAKVNLFNLNINSDIRGFINGLVFGINMVGLLCIVFLLEKWKREA